MDDLFDDDIDIFFGEADEEELQARRPSFSLLHSQEGKIKTHLTKN